MRAPAPGRGNGRRIDGQRPDNTRVDHASADDLVDTKDRICALLAARPAACRRAHFFSESIRNRTQRAINEALAELLSEGILHKSVIPQSGHGGRPTVLWSLVQ